MTLREALRAKKMNLQEMEHKINSWTIYGEESLVLFYANWECRSENLDKLLDYLSLVNRLVVALPKKTSDDIIFQIANLQVVDGIVLYEDLDQSLAGFSTAKFAFEGTAPSDPNLYKSRTLAL